MFICRPYMRTYRALGASSPWRGVPQRPLKGELILAMGLRHTPPLVCPLISALSSHRRRRSAFVRPARSMLRSSSSLRSFSRASLRSCCTARHFIAEQQAIAIVSIHKYVAFEIEGMTSPDLGRSE